MLHDNLGVNEQGHLTIGGVDTLALAEKYGTPLYVMDEDKLRSNCRIYTSAFAKYMPSGSMPLFASKSLCCKRIYSVIDSEGMGTDLVSPGELYTASAAGFELQKAFFHGNNKTDADIEYAVDSGVGFFIIDNREEADKLNSYAASKGIKQKALLRLTPGIDPHTHAKISTGKVDSKFGTAIETGQAEQFIAYVLGLSNIDLRGYHCHIGSQIFDIAPFTDAADIMLDFAGFINKKYGYMCEYLNLGGGFGVRYVESDPDIDIDANIKAVSEHISGRCAANAIPVPKILMEPGRSIVADAGLTLYTVGSVKEITGFKNYVSIDGGMTDNPRYALYQSPYTVLNAGRADVRPDYVCTVAGRCCESGDLIQEDVKIVKPARGDVIAVLVTGAYNHAMAMTYNKVPRPAMVFLKDGKDSLAVRRETYADLMALDV